MPLTASGQEDAPGSPGSTPPPPTSRRRGRIIGRFLAVVAGLTFPLLLLELFFRFGGPLTPTEFQTAQLVVASEVFGRQNMANRAGTKRTDEYEVRVRVNSQGLRGEDVPYEKPPGVYRILVVGDSFTFGAQVEEEQTLSVLLGQELRAAAARDGSLPQQIETINAGVDGWNTANELAWLKTEGLRYQPDVVVLMYFTGNDPGENYDWMKAVKRAGVELDPTVNLPGRDLRRWLADTSRLYAFLELAIIPRLMPPPQAADLAHLDESMDLRVRRSSDPDRHEQGWQLSGDLIRQMRAFTDEKRIGLLVVGIPTVEHVINADRPPTPFLSITEAAGAPALDLLMPFRAVSDDARAGLYFPKDRHWTPAGHAEATRHVSAELVRRGLVRSAASAR